MMIDVATFEDCAEQIRETVNPSEVGEMPYIGLEHINENSLTLNGHGKASEVESMKFKFMKGDILFGKLRPYFRKVVIAPFDGVCSTDMWVVRSKNGVDQKYLFYWMASQQFVDVAMQGSEGTKMPRAKWEFVARQENQVTDPKDQHNIGCILGALDDKIELNCKVNETLEAIAKAIFKSWFVDFDPVHAKMAGKKPVGMDETTTALFPDSFEDSELGQIPLGWEVLTIADVCNFQNGYAFKSKELSDLDIDSYRVFKMGNIEKGGGFKRNGSDSYIPKHKCHNIIRYLLKKGDLLMCMTDMKSSMALLGHTALMDVDNEYIVNQRVGRITAKDKSTVNYPYLYMLSNSPEFIQSLRSRANSGVQVNLSTAEILSTKILLPNKQIHGKYNDIAECIFEKIFVNNFEIGTLMKIRDLLLPKLISGEIEVK